MSAKLLGLVFGVAFGFVLSWSQVTDPMVIRKMLLLREPDVFLLMGAAIVVAAIGVRVLRAVRAQSLLTHERIQWAVARPAVRHVAGSVLFGAGWSVAATCPGPMTAMLGEGRLGGLFVVAGVVAGIALQGLAVSPGAPGQVGSEQPAATCV